MRDVLIPVFDGLQSLDLTGPLEVFAHAGAYRVTTASLGGHPVSTTSGVRITPDADLRGQDANTLHLLLVPGGEGARRRDEDLVSWIREAAPRVTRVASVCTGAFLLAEAGLLSGRRVTTHWSRAAALAEQYPDLNVDPDPTPASAPPNTAAASARPLTPEELT